MHPSAVHPDRDSNPFGPAAHLAGDDWVDARAEALDMALAARAARVPDEDVRAAFGVEAARLARLAAALDGVAPPAPTAAAPFVAALEAHLGRAFDARRVAPVGIVAPPNRTARAARLVARPLGLSDLAMAAAITLAVGAATVRDGWRPAPALAATPTSVLRTQTPLGPTGTATGSTPAALATSEPMAMLPGAEDAGVY